MKRYRAQTVFVDITSTEPRNGDLVMWGDVKLLLDAKDAEVETLKRQLCEYADGAEMLPDPDDAAQRRGGE